VKPSLLIVLLSTLLLSGCWGWVEYFDVVADEIKVPEGVTDVIPQEGTTLALNLTYEYVPRTKFEPGEDWKQYRYRVLIDGWEYCYGVTDEDNYDVTIPIMANDSHSPASIVVEGSKAHDYEENPKEWEDWHELYCGTQECLPESETPKYDNLKDKQLKVTIDGKSFLFDIRDTGAGQAFKRLMSDRTVNLSICLDDFLFVHEDAEGFERKLGNIIPPSFGKACYKHKVGEIRLEKNGWFGICLKEKEIYGYDTILGTVCPEDLKAFKKLYPGYHNQVQTTMTMSLVSPARGLVKNQEILE